MGWADLKHFLETNQPEDARIDYKGEFDDRVTESIAAMANTRGGIILVGVGEDDQKQPRWPPHGISRTTHAGGQVLVTHCQRTLYPIYVPRFQLVPIPRQKGKAVLLVQVRVDEAPTPIWHERQGVRVRIGDQNQPADLSTLDGLLQREATREQPRRQRATALISQMLAESGSGAPTSVVCAATIRQAATAVPWTSDDRQQLTELMLSHIQRRDRMHVESRARSIMIMGPGNDQYELARGGENGVPWIHGYVDAAGVVALKIGWRADPFPVAAILAGLWFGLDIVLAEQVASIFQPIAPMEVTLGLVNWPYGGIDPGALFGATQLSQGETRHSEHSVSEAYRAAAGSAPESLMAAFLDLVLAEAGWTGYEPFLPNLPRASWNTVLQVKGLKLP